MAYRRSLPLQRWLTERRDNIDVLEAAHAALGDVTGPGRPLELGRPVAHAYLLRVVAEFQGFVRELHDLAADRVVQLSNSDAAFHALLVEGITHGRAIDRGNADVRSLESDFRRVGLTGLRSKLAHRTVRWSSAQGRRGDEAYYNDLIALRNALAHGNEGQLKSRRSQGSLDTVSWARARLPGLNRTGAALDRVLWDHLKQTFGAEPW